jgi:hypothetical protein
MRRKRMKVVLRNVGWRKLDVEKKQMSSNEGMRRVLCARLRRFDRSERLVWSLVVKNAQRTEKANFKLCSSFTTIPATAQNVSEFGHRAVGVLCRDQRCTDEGGNNNNVTRNITE